MKTLYRSTTLLLVTLLALSGCSAHCTCPTPDASAPTTIIHEHPSNY